MASNIDAKSVVEDITSTTKLLDTKQSNNTPSTAASSTTKSENYFTANEQHQDNSESENEQQSQSDNESMNENDDNSDDAMSEYSYCISDDGEDDEEEVYDPTKNKSANKIQHQPVSVTHAGAKRKANNPLAELDDILNGIKDVVEGESRSTSPVPPPNAAAATTSASTAANAATATATTKPKTSGTSTLKAGVGYETGAYTTSTTTLNKHMSEAATKQGKVDDASQLLIDRLATFVQEYDGSEGMVLLALKMSPSFNRMLFNLLKNDLLIEWGKRKKIYGSTLDLLDTFAASPFYVPFLLHNLLEGNGLPDDGKATIEALLDILNTKAVIMVRSQKKMAAKSEDATNEEADTLAICEKIVATSDKVTQAIKEGRESGVVVNPANETTSKDMAGSGPTHLMNALLEEAKFKPPPTAKEEHESYIKGMTAHRLNHVEIIKAAKESTTPYKYYTEVTGTASSASGINKKRMVHIASEIAGLSADLPVEWYSGIYVRVDEDRPDVLKACIIAPEGTPYENGCFEFDILLPLDYPNVPPKVQIITTNHGSVRFNPNLYNGGKVCLSLLGTWSGPGWIPGTSTLLQVLLSIQSLIFVDKPYFNEPGYNASCASQQKQSDTYDRQIRAATLKVAMLGQMQKPSPLFEDCMNDHFRLKKRRILEQLDEWEALEEKNDKSGGSSGALVAGGGIRSTHKIVKEICDEIRNVYDPKEVDSDDEDAIRYNDYPNYCRITGADAKQTSL